MKHGRYLGNWKWEGVEHNEAKCGSRGVVVTCLWGILDNLMFEVVLGSFGVFVSKWPVTRNGWPCSEQSEIRELVVVATCISGTFDLFVFKIILGSFSALCLKMACNFKTACCRQRNSEIWDFRGNCSTFDLQVFKIILSYSVHLSQNGLQIEKKLAVEQNGVKMGLVGSCNTYMGCLDLLVFKVILSQSM